MAATRSLRRVTCVANPRCLIALVLVISLTACKPTGPDALSLGTAGVATPQPDTLTVAAPLVNVTDKGVTNITIEHVELASAALRTSLPITVGNIPGNGGEIVQADFESKSLVSGKNTNLYSRANIGATMARPDHGVSGCTPLSLHLLLRPAQATSGRLTSHPRRSTAASIPHSSRVWTRT